MLPSIQLRMSLNYICVLQRRSFATNNANRLLQ
jgi:hypothetical protein